VGGPGGYPSVLTSRTGTRAVARAGACLEVRGARDHETARRRHSMANTRLRMASLFAAAAVVVGACGTTPAASGGAASGGASASACNASGTAAGTGTLQIPDVVAGKFNVAMVLIGPHDDGGWSQAHYEGLQYVCDHVADTHVAYIELVPEGATSEQVFRSLARKGFNFIIGTSFGYMDPMGTVAEEFPDATFLHLTGYKSNGKNFGNFFGAMEDFKYLAGMLAGSRAKKDGNPKVGYMATFPIPEELRLGNAITRGVKVTCPECTVDVRFINTWHDPQKERDGAASLFDAGAQVVFTGADTGAVADVAAEKKKWAVTYDHPASCNNDACLTAPYWIWGPEYTRIAQQVKDKKYKAGYEYFDADSKAMALLGFMEGQTPRKGVADLPAADLQAVKDTLAKMLAGTLGRFDVFAGPIKDNTGKELLPAGQKLKQSDLDQFPPGAPGSECSVCMYWWNDGITVPLPKL
jgi:basic membrane protein A